MYVVHYASAGCLPEADPMGFESLEEAAEYVWDEWVKSANEVLAHADYASAEYRAEITELLNRDEYDHVAEMMGAADPWPTSLYRWFIEET